MPEKSRAFASNRILAKLSAADRKRMAAHLTPVDVQLGQVLGEADIPPDFVYFPVGCMISLVAMVDSKPALEVGLVGREGMTAVSIALGIPGVAGTRGRTGERRLDSHPHSGIRGGI